MRWLLVLPFLLLPLPLAAQETDAAQTARDRSYLTGLIEDNLSGAGREIRLEGFAGALSSRATFDSLTIADEQGVWLTIRNGAMSWDRAALLTGKISVEELSAEEIDLPRLPVTPPSETAPEATPFALPKLPVGVEIGSVKAEKVVLGAPVLGQAAQVQLSGSARLSGGDGEADISATRIDGQKGLVSLRASYAESSGEALLDLLVTEGKDGIAAGLLGLPGRPSLTLSVSGLGPVKEFKADVLLGSAGVSRVTGSVALKGGEGFEAALKGDLSPLLPEDYRDFFGANAVLALAGERSPTGMLKLTRLEVSGQAISVSGGLDLLPGGMPERFDLRAKIGLASGAPVLLPISGPPTRVKAGQLSLAYDRSRGEGWTLDADLGGLQRDADRIERLRLTGSGRIGQPVAGVATVGGRVSLLVEGLAPAEKGLAAALGPNVSASVPFFWQRGKPLSIPALRLSAQDFETTGRVALRDGVDVSADLSAKHSDLSRLSALLGREVSGAVTAELQGDYSLSSGAFDANAEVAAKGLHLDQPQADALFAGPAQISVSARRDETGLTLRGLQAKATGVQLQASGRIGSDASTLTARLAAADLSKLGPGYRGAISLEANLTGALNQRKLTASGKGENLALAQPALNRILAGQSLFSLALAQRDGAFHLSDLNLVTTALSASAKPRKDQASAFDLAAKLSNVALLVPGIAGPAAVSGSLTDLGTAYGLDLRATGPGSTEARIKGKLNADFSSADLAISGRAETALANALLAPQAVQGPLTFDLALKGKPSLAALSGKIAGRSLRFSAPALGQSLRGIDLQADLANGALRLSGQGSFDGGGTLDISGPVQLASPFPAKLALGFNRARLRDPTLYDTRVSGKLSVDGGLTGALRISGALALAETELRIPSGSLGGAAALPAVTHRNEPGDVRQTRLRAGLIETGKASSGPRRVIALDVALSAPQQVFVRGRGLDAELGGALRVTGTTANIVPVGQFSLIRGRLDVLGKRFTLTDGQVALQGALTPWVLFKATTSQDDLDITFKLEGPASEPVLSITSAPELPEEEVLARLLFDKGLSNLSPLQAAQLASAVATLAGKGGDGLVAKLRQSFGLDDLDVGTDDSGNATVRAGKYIAKNVYSDVAVDSNGKAAVTLNLDITKQLTAKGSFGSEGESSLGLFYEKDY